MGASLPVGAVAVRVVGRDDAAAVAARHGAVARVVLGGARCAEPAVVADASVFWAQ